MTAQASLIGGEDPQLVMLSLLNLIRAEFHKEGRSLIEVFSNKEALDVFLQSGRFMIVLKLYMDLIQSDKPKNPSHVMDQNDFAKIRNEHVVEKAKEHAVNIGLVTKLGLKEFEANEQLLDKELKKILLRNHPDKNPSPEAADIAEAANALREMIGHGDYRKYRQIIDEIRKNR